MVISKRNISTAKGKDGALTLFAVVGTQLVTRRYRDYTKAEAIADFQEEFNG